MDILHREARAFTLSLRKANKYKLDPEEEKVYEAIILTAFFAGACTLDAIISDNVTIPVDGRLDGRPDVSEQKIINSVMSEMEIYYRAISSTGVKVRIPAKLKELLERKAS